MSEDLGRYEIANAYIAVAAHRLDRKAEATAALKRIVAAERVERRFAALPMSDALRGAVAETAAALLPAPQSAQLTSPPPQPQIAADTPPAPPRTETIVVPMPPARDAAVLLAEADLELSAGNLAKARDDFAAVLGLPDLPHATLLKAGEGLYRTRDFRDAVAAFDRAGELAKGEEAYHYYYAVALYESGRHADAKRELAAALPFIEATPDVKRYREKIEQAGK